MMFLYLRIRVGIVVFFTNRSCRKMVNRQLCFTFDFDEIIVFASRPTLPINKSRLLISNVCVFFPAACVCAFFFLHALLTLFCFKGNSSEPSLGFKKHIFRRLVSQLTDILYKLALILLHIIIMMH